MSSSTSIPVSRTEFMRLITRIEQLEAEISMFRKWAEKTDRNQVDESKKSGKNQVEDEKLESDDYGDSLPVSRKRLIGKNSKAKIDFQ